MDATQILNRQINKNIQTKFYTWTRDILDFITSKFGRFIIDWSVENMT